MNFRSLLENSRSLTNAQFGTSATAPMDASATRQAATDTMKVDPMDHDVTEVTMARIERPLDQLELQSRKLWQKTARSRDGASEARAFVLIPRLHGDYCMVDNICLLDAVLMRIKWLRR